MLTTPRIIIIDDDKKDLDSLTDTLYKHGVACLPIHFTGDPEGIKACPNVRVIFADLNLVGSSSDDTVNFSTLGSLIEETIKPAGPYFILLWTSYPDKASDFRKFLHQRLLGRTVRPFDVRALDKSQFIDEGELKNPSDLICTILNIANEQTELSALFDWENRVLGATGDSVSAVLELIPTEETDAQALELGKILSILGSAAVGESNVADDPFRAINDAMIPILVDRVVNLPADPDQVVLWQKAVNVDSQRSPTDMQASRLNAMVHIAPPNSVKGSERGTVIKLPDRLRDNFCIEFNLIEADAALKQFRCKGYNPMDEKFCWVLVQVQAACDYAQQHPGSILCYLGLDLRKENVRRNRKAPEALWESPSFELDEESRLLHVNARFPVSLSSIEFKKSKPLYRLRESILNDLTYRLHSYGARPGIISFRSR